MRGAPVLSRYNYLREGAEIYRRSFATIRTEADLARFARDEEHVAVRMIHACGMVDIADALVFSAISTMPQAWMIRTAIFSSSGEKRARSASVRIVAKERR